MPTPDFSTFPEVSKADWLTAVRQQLKGKDPGTLGLVVEGIRIGPFAHPDDRPEARPPVPVPGRWTVSEQFMVTEDPVTTNRLLLEALQGGVQAPEMLLTQPLDATQLQNLLKGVEAAYIDLHIVDEAGDPQLAEKLNGVLGGHWTGTLTSPELQTQHYAGVRDLSCKQEELPDEAAVVTQLTALYRQTLVHFAAADDKAGAAARLHFQVCVGRQYLVEIAKLRALRILTAHACASYDLTQVVLPAVAAYAHPGAFDANTYTNMIRWGSMALSAVVGGADRVTAPLLPGTAEVTETFKRRIARNALHVFQLEGGVAELHDPAAGSFYLEELTDRLVTAVLDRIG